MTEKEFVVWNFLRYRDPKRQRPVDRQAELAGWVGFFMGFCLGIFATALLLMN